jgi:lactoylglutathione lyase
MAAASILSAACSYPRRHPAAPHLSHSARFKVPDAMPEALD